MIIPEETLVHPLRIVNKLRNYIHLRKWTYYQSFANPQQESSAKVLYSSSKKLLKRRIFFLKTFILTIITKKFGLRNLDKALGFQLNQPFYKSIHMKHYTSFFLLLLSFLLFSCRNQGNSAQHTHIQKDSLSCTAKHIQIPPSTEVLELKSYYITSPVDFDSIKGIMAYNYRLHSLDLINLEENDHTISSIPLQKEGPNGIAGRISGICPVSKDSIWVYDGISMYLIDNTGNVCDKISFQNKENIIINTNYAMCTARFFYNKDRASLLYLTDRDSLIIEEYDVKARRIIKEYPLSYSVSNAARELVYGDMDAPNVSFTTGKIIYNYPYESNIYLLDMKSGKQSVIDAESSYTPNIAQKCTANGYATWEKHRIENIHFFDVMYLPKSEKFIRLHLGEATFDSQKPVLSLLDSKGLYLSVFDKDFHCMGETKLTDKKYNLFTGWCALADALLLFNDNSLSEATDYDNLSIDIITPTFAHTTK